MKLSIVIPCYNEEGNVRLLLEGFSRVISRNDIELIIVNNNSTDNTEKVLKKALLDFNFFRYLNEERKGYGQAVLAGLAEAKGEYVSWTHGDLQTPPGDLIKALEIIEARGNPRDVYLKGKRRGRRLFDILFTIGMSVFETLFLKTKLWDINAQPNIFHKDFLATWKNPPRDFSLDLYALYLARKNKIKVIRFPVVFPPRQHGDSSWNTGLAAKWKFIKRTIAFSLKLKNDLKTR